MTRIYLKKNCCCFVSGLYFDFYYEISPFMEQSELGKMISFSSMDLNGTFLEANGVQCIVPAYYLCCSSKMCYILPELLNKLGSVLQSDENAFWLLLLSYFITYCPCLSLTFAGLMLQPKDI